ncbi:MAG: hypothetical protein ABI358_06175 [Ginsengibacter sp.]
MNSRSNNYFIKNKAERNKNIKPVEEAKGGKKQKSSIQKNTATQDDTGGGNDSGKKIG